MNQPMDISGVKVLAFDADDTLWDCQGHFEEATDRYCEILSPFADVETVRASLFQTETKNMPDLGFGTKAFTLSLVENAVKVSKGKVPAEDIGRILELGRGLLHLPATPLDGVEETLRYIEGLHRFDMVLFTKGELLDQEHKLQPPQERGVNGRLRLEPRRSFWLPHRHQHPQWHELRTLQVV